MAVNKRKVLDAARKYAQKGAKEKALKEYHTLLKLDPRDAKLHLEIGDCYRRWGQIDEAITQYTRVAEPMSPLPPDTRTQSPDMSQKHSDLTLCDELAAGFCDVELELGCVSGGVHRSHPCDQPRLFTDVERPVKEDL